MSELRASAMSPAQRENRPAPQRIDESLRVKVCPEGDGSGEVAPAFGPVSACLPVRPDRPREPQRAVDVPALEQVLERSPQVGVLGMEPFEPRPSLPRAQLRMRTLAELDVPGSVTVPKPRRIRELVEPFGRELANRLQHPERSLVRRSRLCRRASDCVDVGAQIASTASSVQPPVNTARRANRSCSAGVSRSWLQAIVARSVRCRSGADREPPASRGSRCTSRSSRASGERTFTLAAASSIASGRQSSRRQISTTSPFAAKSEFTARARCTKRSTASRSRSGSTATSHSPSTWSGSRLVTSTVSCGHEPIVSATPGAASRRCSKLSSTSSSRLSPHRRRQGVLRAERLRGGILDERRICKRGERHPPDTVVVVVCGGSRRLQREPRLAASARSGQRHQPKVGPSQQRRRAGRSPARGRETG